jgi:hypothetical protein
VPPVFISVPMAQESRQDISLVRAARTEPPSFPSTATATITLGEYLGITKDATFEVSTKLDRAWLKATVPGFVDESGAEAPAVVDLTWTGAGELFRETDRIRVKFPARC